MVDLYKSAIFFLSFTFISCVTRGLVSILTYSCNLPYHLLETLPIKENEIDFNFFLMLKNK